MSLKNIIENHLIYAYSVEFDGDNFYHPIRVIQAVKSLIGIDPENPNEKLLNWIPTYLDQFHFRKNENKKESKVEFFASMINLEILLKEKKYNESKDEILRLLHVSTGEPILELLVHISLQDITTLPIVNSIYRSVKFCNGHEVKTAILLAVDLLKLNKVKITHLSKFQKLEIQSNLIEVSNSQYIRNDDIQSEINGVDNSIFQNGFIFREKSNLHSELIKNGRGYLLDIINENDNILNEPENILIMDSIRTLLRYRNSEEFDRHLKYASKLIEDLIE